MVPGRAAVRGRQAVQVLLCGVLTAVAAVPALRVFTPAGGAVPAAASRAVLLAVAVATGCGVVAARWPRGRLDALAAAGGVLAVAAAVALTTRPGGAVLSGPYRLLSGALPVDPTGPELAAVAALAGYAALASGYLVRSAGAGALPLLPPVVTLGLGLALSASTGGPPAWCAPAFLAAAALVMLAGHLAGRPDEMPTGKPDGSRLGQLAGGAGPAASPPAGRAARDGRPAVSAVLTGMVTVALVAGLVMPWLGAAHSAGNRAPADLRSLVPASVQPRQQLNPMAQFLALRTGKVPLRIEGQATGPVPRLRMVTLTAFDGMDWTVRADYRRAGTNLPAGTAAGSGGAPRQQAVTADLTIGTPANVGWLPTPGRATAISVPGLTVDETTGDLAVPAGMETPRQYRVTGSEPRPADVDLRLDRPATGPGLGIPLPPELAAFVTTATAHSTGGFGSFSDLYAAFRGTGSPFRLDGSQDPPGGNGDYRIRQLISTRRGTSEQYASAFAVSCRYLGWDARVVLGVRPTQHGDRLTATGRDIDAWVEVRFVRLGWVPVFPSPTRYARGGSVPAEPDPVGKAVTDDRGSRQSPDPRSSPSPGDGSGHDRTPRPTGSHSVLFPVLVCLLGGLGTATVLLLAGVPLARSRRRHRRLTASAPRAQVFGAWQEAVEALAAHRVPVPRRSTTGQAVVAAGTLGRPHLRQLADRADHAGYAPETVTAAQAAEAWRHSDAVRRQASAHATRYVRAVAVFRPRARR
jgi:transglutaminase-like putative cysteine protease